MTCETPDYLRMLERLIRRAGERVADESEVDLADLVKLRATLEEAIAAAVTGQREQHGQSWAYVARGLGTTRQAAQERYDRRRSA